MKARSSFGLVALIVFPLLAAAQPEVEDAKKYQGNLDKEFKDRDTSPLEGKTLRKFKGLPFYAIDLKYRVVAKLQLTPDSQFKQIKTTTPRVAYSRVFGILEFTLDGKNIKIPVYQSKELMAREELKDYLFFPFTDLTNGEETYGGGRYIDLRIPKEGDEIVIDFNKAYNPTCAYSPKYSCPIVPDENHIDVSVKAGVKYEGHH